MPDHLTRLTNNLEHSHVPNFIVTVLYRRCGRTLDFYIYGAFSVASCPKALDAMEQSSPRIDPTPLYRCDVQAPDSPVEDLEASSRHASQEAASSLSNLVAQALPISNIGTLQVGDFEAHAFIPVRRGRGRPRGSINRTKANSSHQLSLLPHAEAIPPSRPIKKRRGRPLGSKNKTVGLNTEHSDGRAVRRHEDAVNHNVKLTFRHMISPSPGQDEFWEQVAPTSPSGLARQATFALSTDYAGNERVHGGDTSTDYPGSLNVEEIAEAFERYGSDDGIERHEIEPRIESDLSRVPEPTQPSIEPRRRLTVTTKKKRGRPAGSKLVDGKLVIPADFVHVETFRTDGYQKSTGALLAPLGPGERRKRGRPRREDYVDVANHVRGSHDFPTHERSAPALDLPQNRKMLKRLPIIRRSFGGALPTHQPRAAAETLPGFSKFLRLPEEIQTLIWDLAIDIEQAFVEVRYDPTQDRLVTTGPPLAILSVAYGYHKGVVPIRLSFHQSERTSALMHPPGPHYMRPDLDTLFLPDYHFISSHIDAFLAQPGIQVVKHIGITPGIATWLSPVQIFSCVRSFDFDKTCLTRTQETVAGITTGADPPHSALGHSLVGRIIAGLPNIKSISIIATCPHQRMESKEYYEMHNIDDVRDDKSTRRAHRRMSFSGLRSALTTWKESGHLQSAVIPEVREMRLRRKGWRHALVSGRGTENPYAVWDDEDDKSFPFGTND